MADKIAELRRTFEQKYGGAKLDERDVAWIKTDDRFMTAVLESFKCKGDVAKGADMLNSILQFRAKWKLNDLKESDLNKEVLERNMFYFSGTDRKGHRILHFKVCKIIKGELVKEEQQCLAFYMNQHYRQDPSKQMIILFDFMYAGVANVDFDVIKFNMECTRTYFPCIHAHALLFKMPTALEAVHKITKGWLDSEQSKKVIYVRRSNIQEYIDVSQLERHMMKEKMKESYKKTSNE